MNYTASPDHSKSPYCTYCGIPQPLFRQYACANLKQHQIRKGKP